MRITPTRARWFGRLGALLVRLLGCTWRVRERGRDHGFTPEYILAFSHGVMLIPAYHYRRSQAAVMISQHGDGEVIAQVVRRLGFVPVRGSSTRGGARAALEMLRQCGARPWGITPDGPRGPRGCVHEGVIQLASESGRSIHPVGYAVARGKRLRSWDRFVIPAPFTRIVSYLGPALTVPKDLDPDQRAALARELESRLGAAEADAGRELDRWVGRAPAGAHGGAADPDPGAESRGS